MNEFPCSTLDKCRLTYGLTLTTLMAYFPVYDGRGYETTSDPNTRTTTVQCSTCHRQLVMRTTNGKTSWEPVTTLEGKP